MRRTFWLVASFAALAVMLSAGCTGTSDPGKTIFTTGKGHAGPIPRSSMGRAPSTKGGACAMCHGDKGQGTGNGPSITRATLGSKHAITHKPSATDPSPQPVEEGPWTTAQTVEVARTGKTPEGNQLGGRMPAWQLDAEDAAALAAYLGKL